MTPEGFLTLDWLAPWRPATQGAHLEAELEREVGPGHPLHGVRAVAVGRRLDSDDVLFFIPGPQARLVVVHLTWKGGREVDPSSPGTIFFASPEEWVERCMRPAHVELQASR